jgi:MFS family permease
MESGSIDASYAVALDSRRRNLLVWRLAAVAGFTGVLFGYDISAINDAVSARPALIIGVGAALMNALVGVGAVIYYSTDIFQTAGVGSAEVASLAVGAVNTMMTIVAVFLIARFRRRPLLLVGLTGIVISLVIAGVSLLVPSPGWITVVGLLGFVASFAISAGPIAWLIVAEVFPLAIRGRAASFATSTNWAANFVLALAFPLFVGTPGVPARVGAAFFIYAAISVGFIVFVVRLVPETKDRTLEEIEADLSARV